MSKEECNEIIAYTAAVVVELRKKLSILIGVSSVVIIAELLQIIVLLLK